MNRSIRRVIGATAAAAFLLGGLAACGDDSDAVASSPDATAPTLRLGYFANLTHATPLVGLKQGFYADELGDTKLETQTFNAGPAAVEALFGGALDATYIGPNPSINAFVKSNGEAVRIISGTTSGGASFVVQPDVDGIDDLKGTTVASPQLGNTQDVALRWWLKEQGVPVSVTGTSEVTVAPSENATTLQLFKDKKISGAWVPEPWASRLVLEGGGKVLVNEKDEWPDGRFVTTNLLVRKEFLDQYPGTVAALLRAQVATTQWIEENPDQAKIDVNAQLKELTTKALPDAVIDRAWPELTITDDPVASTLQESADHAFEVGTLKEEADLKGIYDLTLLNRILRDEGLPTVSAAGLGSE